MEENRQGRPFRGVMKELAESSSVHGIPKTVSSRQVAVKILWCILIIAGFCILTVQLVALFRTFMSHPVQTTVSLDFSTLRFPAITFCNMNPVRKLKIGMSSQLRDTLFPKRKTTNTLSPVDGMLEQVPLEETVSRKKRGLIDGNDTLPVLNETLIEADDIESGSIIDGNETYYDVLSIYGGNQSSFEAQNDTVTESPLESSSYLSFSYDYDLHHVWDIFEYYDIDDNYNLSAKNLSFAEDHESLTEHYQDPKDKWELLITRFKTTFRNVSVEKRKRMGHQMTDFIQHASFAKREQNVSKYFNQFTTSDYGNCYTMDHPKYQAWGSGPGGGIKLTLYLEVDEYIENFSSGYGVRVVFHEPGTFPMPAEEGLTLSPGYETSIGLRAINVTRLGEPYGNCTKNGKEDFRRKYNISYSKTACLAFCRVENVIKTCECVPFDAPDINFGTKQPICGMNFWDEFCVDYVNNEFEHGALGCDCISPCTEFVYSKTMSGRVWPHKDYLEKVLMKDICRKNLTSLKDACSQIQNETVDFNYERYKNNFVRVLIYFEDLNYEKITEEPFYTTVRFVSDIGGAAGLFMGISLLSFFEVLQLVLEIVLHLFNSNRITRKESEMLKQNNLS